MDWPWRIKMSEAISTPVVGGASRLRLIQPLSRILDARRFYPTENLISPTPHVY